MIYQSQKRSWRTVKFLTILFLSSICLTACSYVQVVGGNQQTLPSTDFFLLFAHSDDLWRADTDGRNIERLTENGLLNWNMDQEGNWIQAALYRPPQASPNGKWVVLSQTGLDLRLVNVETHEQQLLPAPGASTVAWSSDSRLFAYAAVADEKEQLFVYNIYSHQRMSLLELESDSDGRLHSITWSPDGDRIAFICCTNQASSEVSENTEVQVVEVSSKEVVKVKEVAASFASRPPLCWLADGTVTTSTQESIYCSDDQSFSRARSLNGEYLAILGPQSSEDEFWTGPSQLTVEQIDTGEVVWQRDLAENFKVVRWLPGEEYLALDDVSANSPIWRIQLNAEGSPEIFVEEGFLLDTVSQ